MKSASRHSKYRPLWIASLALIALPPAMHLLGLSVNTATMVVILAIATMALNMCVGYTGLVSFGHSTWFGIGAYAAGLIQLHWFHDQIWLPLVLSMIVVAVLSTVVGILILRRRGVYFSLLTLALAALTYTVAFRWSEVTGGEDGLSGLKRGGLGPFNLDDGLDLLHRGRADRARRAVRAAARGALAVRPRAGGDPREPAARHVSGLSGRALQAGGVRALGGGDGIGRRAARIPDLPRLGGSGLGAVFRRVAGDGRDRRHAQYYGAGAGLAVLHPVPRTVFDLEFGLAALVRTDLRRLRAVLARRPGRHLGQADPALAPGAGRSGGDEQAQDLRRLAAAGIPAPARDNRHRAGGRGRLQALRRHPRRHRCEPHDRRQRRSMP